MKIFIGLIEIAGYYANLARGFNELGIEAVFVDLSDHPFRYGNGSSHVLVRLDKYAARKRASTPRSRMIPKLFWVGLETVARTLLFLWAVAKFDVFMFGFATSFFGYSDLPILKWLGKKIIYVFNGSDSRPPYIDGSIMAADSGKTTENCIQLTRATKRRLKIIARYADVILDYPPAAQLHEKPFVNSQLMGVPYQIQEVYLPNPPRSDGHAVRILHSPSHPEAKGTPRIRQAIQNLQAKGYSIEFIGITGKPNTVVLDELKQCDFVVDQLYSDAPLPGFATEAAWFGKPAVVGGYVWEALKSMLPADHISVSQLCHPDDIEAAIEQLMVDKAHRLDLGRRARQFVENYWTPRHVAGRYLQVIEGRVPTEWMCDPRDIRYLHGCGLAEQRAKELVRVIIQTGGTEALQLADKPELESLFMEFAGVERSEYSSDARDSRGVRQEAQ